MRGLCQSSPQLLLTLLNSVVTSLWKCPNSSGLEGLSLPVSPDSPDVPLGDCAHLAHQASLHPTFALVLNNQQLNERMKVYDVLGEHVTGKVGLPCTPLRHWWLCVWKVSIVVDRCTSEWGCGGHATHLQEAMMRCSQAWGHNPHRPVHCSHHAHPPIYSSIPQAKKQPEVSRKAWPRITHSTKQHAGRVPTSWTAHLTGEPIKSHRQPLHKAGSFTLSY